MATFEVTLHRSLAVMSLTFLCRMVGKPHVSSSEHAPRRASCCTHTWLADGKMPNHIAGRERHQSGEVPNRDARLTSLVAIATYTLPIRHVTSFSAIDLLSTCAICWIYGKGFRLAG